MKNLTVFTPTYNRAHLLPRLYDSLKNQTCKNFLWMIIDDGSTDHTKDLVTKWQNEKKIEIQYLYKENQGMHSAHNLAYQNIETSFNVCIDSDDFMPKNAIEIINKETEEIQKHTIFCGIVGLDATQDYKIIGKKIPENLIKVKLNTLYQIHKITGDKKLVYKTDYIKQAPEYPIFEGEKFVPLDYKYLLLDQKYFLKPINEILCIVEYQDDGSSKNMLKQYRRHPKGFAFSRIQNINYGISFKKKLKNAAHLVSCCLFTKDFKTCLQSKRTDLVFLMIPVGILLHLYIRLKTNRNL